MTAPIIAAGVGAAGGLLGGIFGNNSAAAEAAKNRRFQERMSNTQYQRGVADMRSAGLNPALAYQQGGASSPSGSSASQNDPIAPAIRGAEAGVSSALAAARNKVDLAKTLADTRRVSAEADYLERTMDSREYTAKGAMALQDEEKTRRRYANTFFANSAQDRLDYIKGTVKTQGLQQSGLGFSNEGMRLSNVLSRFDIPGASAGAARDSSWFGQYIMPYISSALDLTKGAMQFRPKFKPTFTRGRVRP